MDTEDLIVFGFDPKRVRVHLKGSAEDFRPGKPAQFIGWLVLEKNSSTSNLIRYRTLLFDIAQEHVPSPFYYKRTWPTT